MAFGRRGGETILVPLLCFADRLDKWHGALRVSFIFAISTYGHLLATKYPLCWTLFGRLTLLLLVLSVWMLVVAHFQDRREADATG